MTVLEKLRSVLQILRLPADHGGAVPLPRNGDGPATIRPAAAGTAPAVPVEDSVQHDYIVCLETGMQLPLLRRHLQQRLGLSVEDYRRKWQLPADYPLVAPAYAEARDAARRVNEQEK